MSSPPPVAVVNEVVRRAVDAGEDAVKVGIGLTILGVNRLQVQRRELMKALKPESDLSGEPETSQKPAEKRSNKPSDKPSDK